MRPDSAPHLYDPSMVPNLLPFSASVTTGAGSTQSATATPQGQPGFAAMLGLGMTPVTQDATGTPVAVSVMPLGTAPLLGLTDGSIEAALPDLANSADPATFDAPPIATLPEAPIKVAAPAPSPEGGSVTVVDGPLKTPEPVLETVTVVDGPYKPAPIAEPAPGDLETVTVVDGPYKPAPIAKPVAEPAPDGDGGTVTTVDRPDKSVETAPVAGPVPVVAPIVKPASPIPTPEGGSVTIVEPVRKTSAPKTPPVVEDGRHPDHTARDRSRRCAGRSRAGGDRGRGRSAGCRDARRCACCTSSAGRARRRLGDPGPSRDQRYSGPARK